MTALLTDLKRMGSMKAPDGFAERVLIEVGLADSYAVFETVLGEVYVALDTELNREIALKEIQSKYADDLDSRARFLLEAEITGGLEHPGVVPVYALANTPTADRSMPCDSSALSPRVNSKRQNL